MIHLGPISLSNVRSPRLSGERSTGGGRLGVIKGEWWMKRDEGGIPHQLVVWFHPLDKAELRLAVSEDLGVYVSQEPEDLPYGATNILTSGGFHTSHLTRAGVPHWI